METWGEGSHFHLAATVLEVRRDSFLIELCTPILKGLTFPFLPLSFHWLQCEICRATIMITFISHPAPTGTGEGVGRYANTRKATHTQHATGNQLLENGSFSALLRPRFLVQL